MPEEDEELSIAEMMTEGCICLICIAPFAEIYGYPKACEECGGDGFLDETVSNENA